MNLEKSPTANQYQLTELSFSQLKTIRDACSAYAKQGSSLAGTISTEIEKYMENIVI